MALHRRHDSNRPSKVKDDLHAEVPAKPSIQPDLRTSQVEDLKSPGAGSIESTGTMGEDDTELRNLQIKLEMLMQQESE